MGRRNTNSPTNAKPFSLGENFVDNASNFKIKPSREYSLNLLIEFKENEQEINKI
jgi:hypothetical protein